MSAGAVGVVFMTTTAVGKQLSERSPKSNEIDALADAIADMLSMYLAQLGIGGMETGR
jgi:hypothetical protein